jgi:carboxyl-terminal processing protease
MFLANRAGKPGAFVRSLPRVILIFCSSALLLLSACADRDPTAELAAVPTPDLPALQARTYEALWVALDDHYIYHDSPEVDRDAIRDNYSAQVADAASHDDFQEAMMAMLGELPGEPQLQTREERIDQAANATFDYGGIGAFVSVRESPEPRVVILDVMEESPAAAAGLTAHDSILAIDGDAVSEIDLDNAVERVRGEPGSALTVTVRSPGEEPREVTLERQLIVASTSGAQLTLLGREGSIAYYLFPVFPSAGFAASFQESFETLQAESPLSGIILDLRISSPSANWPIDELLTMFGNGVIGEVYTRQAANPLVINGRDIAGSQDLPMAIRVGPGTGGLLELMAGGLQAAGRAVLVGDNTAGEVEGMRSFFLPDGSRIFVPTSSFRTPDGRDVGRTGLQPDIAVEEDWDEVTAEADPVIFAAVQALLAEDSS